MNITVIKVGGAIVENPATLGELLDEFVKVEGAKVLVHGGGRTATALASQLGIESRMVGGRRITDGEMLRVVTMVYAGLVNKNIVAQLQARGVNAVGLCGADMNLVRAHRRPVTAEGIDFGFVGDVDSADGTALRTLISAGYTPVIAPLTHDGAGHLLNINADTMAQTVAVALSQSLKPTVGKDGEAVTAARPAVVPAAQSSVARPAVVPAAAQPSAVVSGSVSLTYCFELPGVMRDPADAGSLIAHITPSLFRQLVADGTVSGGMVPKLENAFAAIADGVSQVRITAHTALRGGTLIAGGV